MPELSLLPTLSGSMLHLALAFTAIIAAYTLFTLVGFGSALMASGPLAQVMPVGRIVPLLAVLDLAGASVRGWRARHAVDWPSLRQLLPGMLLGQLMGVAALARLPATSMALALGLFIMIQGLLGLRATPRPPCQPARQALLRGVFGGLLGGLFGSGGFVYAAYLERHLPSRDAFRATQAVLIAVSTGWRILLCLVSGLLDLSLLATTLIFVPAMALGIGLGQRIDLRLRRDQLFRLLNALLVVCGASLILRFAG